MVSQQQHGKEEEEWESIIQTLDIDVVPPVSVF